MKKNKHTALLEEVLKDIVGYNDRGTVEYNDGSLGLGNLIYGKWCGICKSCGKEFKGKDEIESIRFGHIGCPKPMGEYIKQPMSIEDMRQAILKALQRNDEAWKEKVLDIIDSLYPPTFSKDMGGHAIVCRGRRTEIGLIMLTEEEESVIHNIYKLIARL